MRFLFICFMGFFMSVTAGCTTKMSAGMPVAEMTFAHVEPFLITASDVVVQNNYDSVSYPQDASMEFPTPPDLAIRRYAESRLKAAGVNDRLYFVIDESQVSKKTHDSASGFVKWMGTDRRDQYDIVVKLRLYTQSLQGQQSNHSVMVFSRSIEIPQRYSLAEKEMEKLRFMELFMQDIDQAVEETLRKRGWISSDVYAPVPAMDILTTPELR